MFRTVYVGVCFICCILTIHLIGSIYVYYLRSRSLIPKRVVYLMPRPPIGLDSFGRKIPEYFPPPPPPPPPATAPKPVVAQGRIQLEGSPPADVCESQV